MKLKEKQIKHVFEQTIIFLLMMILKMIEYDKHKNRARKFKIQTKKTV